MTSIKMPDMPPSPPLAAYHEEELGEVPVSTTPPNFFFNQYDIKYDARIATSLELSFESIENDTTKAILLNIFDENTGKVVEEWFPKKLCSNLDEAACTIRVWDVFAKDKKGHLFPKTEAGAK